MEKLASFSLNVKFITAYTATFVWFLGKAASRDVTYCRFRQNSAVSYASISYIITHGICFTKCKINATYKIQSKLQILSLILDYSPHFSQSESIKIKPHVHVPENAIKTWVISMFACLQFPLQFESDLENKAWICIAAMRHPEKKASICCLC